MINRKQKKEKNVKRKEEREIFLPESDPESES